MENWGMVELDIEARLAEAQPRQQWPVPPDGPAFWPRRRQAIAKALVWLGVRVDARASHAAIGSMRPRLETGDERMKEAA